LQGGVGRDMLSNIKKRKWTRRTVKKDNKKKKKVWADEAKGQRQRNQSIRNFAGGETKSNRDWGNETTGGGSMKRNK